MNVLVHIFSVNLAHISVGCIPGSEMVGSRISVYCQFFNVFEPIQTPLAVYGFQLFHILTSTWSITCYSCNRIARDSCWWQAKTLTFFLWRHLGPWSHHSSPELPRVGDITGVVLRDEKVTGKYGLEKSYPSTVFVLIQGVRYGKKINNNAEKVFTEEVS